MLLDDKNREALIKALQNREQKKYDRSTIQKNAEQVYKTYST